jgi:hypothetical protein
LGWVQRFGQYLVALALAALILLRGGTSQAAILFACSLLCLACALACFVTIDSAGIRRSRAFAFWIAILLISYIMFQSWEFEVALFPAGIATAFGSPVGVGHAVSVAPGLTRATIFTTALPFLFYFASLSHFAGKGQGLKLLRLLAIFGGCFAAFGMLQLLLFPDSYFFVEKSAYRESLTGPFVNRNNAGTFLGVASMAALGSLIDSRRRLGGNHSVFGHIADRRNSRAERLGLLGYLLIFLICLHALFLTTSRGALAATLLGYMFLVPWMVVRGHYLLDLVPRQIGGGKIAKFYTVPICAAAGLMLVLLVAGVFGGQALYRLGQQSVDAGRVCIYISSARAFLDNWLFGTGFGTFEVVFPLYRTDGCGFVGLSFLRAHNSYLEGLLGLGLPFIPLFLAVTFHLIGTLWSGFKNRERLKFLSIIGGGAIITVYSHAMLDFSVQIPAVAAYVTLLIAAISIVCLEKVRKYEG